MSPTHRGSSLPSRHPQLQTDSPFPLRNQRSGALGQGGLAAAVAAAATALAAAAAPAALPAPPPPLAPAPPGPPPPAVRLGSLFLAGVAAVAAPCRGVRVPVGAAARRAAAVPGVRAAGRPLLDRFVVQDDPAA